MELLLRKKCSIDGSEIIFFEGWYNRKEIPDVEIYYCPVCDIGFMKIGVSKDISYELQWVRKGNDLVLCESDKKYISLFNDYIWHLHQKELLDTIRTHKMRLQNTDSTIEFCCRYDGSSAVKVKAIIIEKERIVFTLCVWCGKGSTYIFDRHYGWTAVSSFFHDLQSKSFILIEKIPLNGKYYYQDSWLSFIPSFPW